LTSSCPDAQSDAITPHSLERQHTLATAVARYDDLRARDLLASTAVGLDNDPFGPGPVPRQEALELLALGELIARKAAYGRQLTVRSARTAGASWSQIGAALGTRYSTGRRRAEANAGSEAASISTASAPACCAAARASRVSR
jgi:hypothetical protein